MPLKFRLLIYFVIYFKGLFAQHSLPCMQNLNCNSINSLPLSYTNNIARSVVRINACGACTGTLLVQAIDNTNELEYLVLTARHCIHQDLLQNGGIQAGLGPQCNLASVRITFNYQNPDCNLPRPFEDNWDYFTDCTLIAEDLNSDLALIKLVDPPPVWFRPYFAGWSVLPQLYNTTGPFYCIHHPGGQEKAVAKSSWATVLQTIPANIDPAVFNINIPFVSGWFAELVDRYYLIWTEGMIQSGSSGAALFNSNEKVIGGLSAGLLTPAWCTNPDANDFATFGQIINFFIDHASVRNALDKTDNILPVLSMDGMEITCYEHDLNLSGDIFPASEYQTDNAVTINSSGTIYLGRNNNYQPDLLTIHNGSEYYFNGQNGVEINYIEEDPNQLVFEVGTTPCTQRNSPQQILRGEYVKGINSINNKPINMLPTISTSNFLFVSPNPISNEMTINFSVVAQEALTFYCFDNVGNIIMQRTISEVNNKEINQQHFSTVNLSLGIYHIKLIGKNTNLQSKFVN